jgi:transposase InsO family protein
MVAGRTEADDLARRFCQLSRHFQAAIPDIESIDGQNDDTSYCRGILARKLTEPVARKRVLRVMREHGLLSPHRRPPRPGEAHDRRITTEAPNLMWGTDATQITTVEDGKVWLFAVVEHWNAEALGWHVAKRGDRFAAVQALGMAVKGVFGSLCAGTARGVAVRHDHGGAFMAEHFRNQVRFWGMAPSYAFVAEPETNGVAERFFRTLKEQVVHGRIYRTLEEVRAAVRAFVDRYNASWLIEKNGLMSPLDARTAWKRGLMKAAA